jgi:hypothetical protein
MGSDKIPKIILKGEKKFRKTYKMMEGLCFVIYAFGLNRTMTINIHTIKILNISNLEQHFVFWS